MDFETLCVKVHVLDLIKNIVENLVRDPPTGTPKDRDEVNKRDACVAKVKEAFRFATKIAEYLLQYFGAFQYLLSSTVFFLLFICSNSSAASCSSEKRNNAFSV